MNKLGAWIAAALVSAAAANPLFPQTPESGYGYLISAGPPAAIWWAEGAYKIRRDDPVPEVRAATIRLSSARNEYEPFLLVLRPETRLEEVRVEASALTTEAGEKIPASAVSVLHVAYVKVTNPTDGLGTAGWWPDPLPPYEGPFTAYPGENSSLWITVRVPREARPGLYRGVVSLSASGPWRSEIDLELRVFSFALPDRPSIRSSFGLPTDHLRRYHNLETRAELEKVVDLYYQNLRDHRLAPASPFDLYPIRIRTSGVYWKGGEFVSENVHGGKRALKVEDDDPLRNVAAEYADPIDISSRTPLEFRWWVRTANEEDAYSILLESLTAEGAWIPSANLLRVYKGSTAWKPEKLAIPPPPDDAAGLRLRLFPVFPDEGGTTKGLAWFDDLVLEAAPKGPEAALFNLLPGGDFEAAAAEMRVEADFGEFDRAARRYLDEFGFNSFNLHLEGLGSGSFYSRREGLFAGFRQGTPEYDRLMSQYLGQVEDHLGRNGWLGKEYIYWFDEPDPKDYPFVRAGMENIRRNAPRLTRFITEHRPGPEIMDVSEIGCTIFDRIDPAAVTTLAPKGREFWSYLCTGPKSPWVTLFIDHPAVNLRIWLWMTYKWGLKGILVWRANYWMSEALFPADEIQNPWQDPMSYVTSYGTPFGQANPWGNGDGRFIYPPNRDPNKDKRKFLSGPVNSIRWEILREGLEDYEYFVLLEKAFKAAGPKKKALVERSKALLDFPAEFFRSGKEYTKDPLDLLKHRRKIAELLEEFAK
jgi:hypothetical protein